MNEIFLSDFFLEELRKYGLLNSLLLTCRSFSTCRKYYYQYDLNKKDSLNFYYNIHLWRDRIYSQKQISLNLGDSGIVDVYPIKDVLKLDLSFNAHIEDVSCLK